MGRSQSFQLFLVKKVFDRVELLFLEVNFCYGIKFTRVKAVGKFKIVKIIEVKNSLFT